MLFAVSRLANVAVAVNRYVVSEELEMPSRRGARRQVPSGGGPSDDAPVAFAAPA